MRVRFQCESCLEECSSEKYYGTRSPFPPPIIIKKVDSIESAKKMEIKCEKCGSNLKFLGVQSKSKKKNPTVKSTSPESKPTGISESKPIGRPVYNELKLNKIKKSTCTNCPPKFKPEECAKSPDMLNLCMKESLEYRLKSGKYGISGESVGDLPVDIDGNIINGTPVYIKDIWRLIIATPDNYSLYDKNDYLKEKPRAQDQYQPPTNGVIYQALTGSGNPPTTIGFRPLNLKTNQYKWICYDIDKHSCERTIYESNPRQAVDEIVNYLKKWYGLTGYIESSGSPESYHVWVFIVPTDKEIVYKFDEDFKARCNPLLNKAICERVNKGDGRMIKLPYTINYKNGVRSKFIDGVDLHKIQPEKLPTIN